MRLIRVCAGIGDNVWLLQKLVNSGEQFKFQLTSSAPQRGKQIFDLLPQVAASCEYVPGLPYVTIEALNIQKKHHLWADVHDKDFCLSCNKHLEAGYRIEEFFPDLPISWKLHYSTGEHMPLQVISDLSLNNPRGGPIIGIYGSSYSTNRAWGFWSEKEWFELIKMIHAERPDIVFAIIGASFDTDLGDKLIALLVGAGIQHMNTLGKPLAYVVELLKRLNYFIAFPSGLPIMNETIEGGCDSLMFYPPHLNRMMYAWANPHRVELRQHIPLLFTTPEIAFEIIRNDYYLFDKLPAK